MKEPIKIVHIVAGSLNSGAAKGAILVHNALLELGLDSRILSDASSDEGIKEVVLVKKTYLYRIMDIFWRLVLRFYPTKTVKIFSVEYFGKTIAHLPDYRSADIVHIHFTRGMISTAAIGRMKKPIIWTLRDMWAFTGGCHYAIECDNFKSTCGKCPMLMSKKKHDLSFLIQRSKFNMYDSVKFTGISKWISNKAMESALLSGHKVETISNCVDINIFGLSDKRVERNIQGINTNKKILLIGAQNLTYPYKGTSIAIASLNMLPPENYLLISFGRGTSFLRESLSENLEHIVLGYLNSQEQMKSTYAMADVFLMPSTMEAFGKTAAESLLCGTPVVCFSDTGTADFTDHKINGYIAHKNDAEDFSKGIEYCVNKLDRSWFKRDNDQYQMKLKLFSPENAAKQYFDLYQSILSQEQKKEISNLL
jgi:glycosyltransferase involved in cell wall biosynthesis